MCSYILHILKQCIPNSDFHTVSKNMYRNLTIMLYLVLYNIYKHLKFYTKNIYSNRNTYMYSSTKIYD